MLYYVQPFVTFLLNLVVVLLQLKMEKMSRYLIRQKVVIVCNSYEI